MVVFAKVQVVQQYTVECKHVEGGNNQQTMNTNVTSASEKQLTQSEVVALLARWNS